MTRYIVTYFALIIAGIAAEKSDLLDRVKIGEAIFDVRFTQTRIEPLLGRTVVAELARLERIEAAREYVIKIRKIFSDVAQDVASSTAFKEQYATWIAGELTKKELETYLEFLRSEVGQKVADLDDRTQPLLFEAIGRRSRGRLESIPLLLAEARTSQ